MGHPKHGLGIAIDNYPKVDGSTSARPLQTIVACKVLGAGYQWIHAEQDDSRTLWASDIQESMREDYHQEKLPLCRDINNRLVQSHGTPEAYANLIDGRADLVVVARSPTDDEWRRAGKLGARLEVRPVALDAFVFLLNANNPVASLTIEQIRDIYSGRIVNWRQHGGPDAPIRPYQRPRNSGSQELMRTLVMKGRAMIEAPDMLTGAIMASPFLTLHDDVHGIGYSVYYYHEFMAPPAAIKACAVEGVLPTSESIRSRRYPFVAEVHVVVRVGLPPGHPAYRLRDWLLGPTGQETVEESGYVAVRDPSNPRPPPARSAADDVEPRWSL